MKFLFAHGAGASKDSPFMERVALGLGNEGIAVVRFNFPYMEHRAAGLRRPPDPQPVLKRTWMELIEQHRDGSPLFIGGKSMGGRIASMIADQAGVAGLICFGYPFHPPGKPQALRTAHLESIRTPTLMVQGTRDALGNRDEVAALHLPPAIRFVWIEDGDHSLKPRRSSGRTGEQSLAEAIAAAAAFMKDGNSASGR